jgi:restriction endonuclease S subunit
MRTSRCAGIALAAFVANAGRYFLLSTHAIVIRRNDMAAKSLLSFFLGW